MNEIFNTEVEAMKHLEAQGFRFHSLSEIFRDQSIWTNDALSSWARIMKRNDGKYITGPGNI